MTMHANETATRAAFEAFSAGDLDGIRAFFADDVTWHQGGADALTGEYHGIDAVIGLLTKQFELSDGTVHAELLDVYATDTRTIAIERVTATRNGATLDTVVPLVFDGTDGRAHEVWSQVFADPATYAAFWGPAE
jgi:ketosteroid isomerase-like protein